MKPAISLAVCTLLFSAACAASVDQVARNASRAAVDEGAEAISNEDTQESLKRAANDPDVQQATRAMVDQIADGLLQALESDRAHNQIAGLTKAVAQGMAQQLVASLGAPPTRTQLEGITRSMTEAAMQQVARSVETDLRPAVGTLIREDVGKGIAEALDAQLQPALGQTAQNVAYNAVLGANDGLGRALTGHDGLAADVREGASMLPTILWLGVTALALLTLALIAGAVMMVARARRTRAELARLESATVLLTNAMRENRAEASAHNKALLDLIEESFRERRDYSGEHRIGESQARNTR